MLANFKAMHRYFTTIEVQTTVSVIIINSACCFAKLHFYIINITYM